MLTGDMFPKKEFIPGFSFHLNNSELKPSGHSNVPVSVRICLQVTTK